MENPGDSSVWRSLAVAFGDGLAFGVGMKLTHNAAGKAASPFPPDLAGRLARVEERMDRLELAPAPAAGAAFDRQLLDSLVHAVDTRLKESAGHMDRCLAELEAKIAVELNSLRQQDRSLAAQMEDFERQFGGQAASLRRQMEEDGAALQKQVVALHREFAAAVANIVEEQVANQVEAAQREIESRLSAGRAAEEALVRGIIEREIGPIELRLYDEIAKATARMPEAAASATQAAIAGQIGPLRDRVGFQGQELETLRRQVEANDHNILDVILAIGNLCRQAAERSQSPVPGKPPAPTEAPETAPGAACGPAPAEPLGDSQLPGFAQPGKVKAFPRIPLFSSFLITAAGLLLLHFM
ncbi:MAG TPA: hypothetical protein VJ732_18225 [Bryobacteraceae bacterium]|nr:hypothetical protein [Bryobacteraceae bacterium]